MKVDYDIKSMAILILYTILMIIRNFYYQSTMQVLYESDYFEVLEIVVKIYLNRVKYGYLKRSLIRNVFFDLMRCISWSILIPMLYFGSFSYERIFYKSLFSIANTVIMWKYLNINVSKNHYVLSSIVIMEWCSTYSTHIIWTINTASDIFNGKIFYMFLAVFIDCHTFLGFTMIEDLIYKSENLNVFGGLFHNWDFYNSYVYGIICQLMIQHYYGYNVIRESFDVEYGLFKWHSIEDEQIIVIQRFLNFVIYASLSCQQSIKFIAWVNSQKIKQI